MVTVIAGCFESSGWNDITVQSSSGTGAKLAVQCMWHEFDEEAQGIMGWYAPVTPKEVSDFICKAKISGWNPEHLGPVFTLKIFPNPNEIPSREILGA